MVFHRDQAQFERARWRKAFLFPLWLLQTATLLGLMGIFSYRLAETVEHYEDDDKNGKMPVVELVWECTNVGFSLVSLILTILEVSRLFSETLTPFFLFASHVIKMTCAFAILGLDIVVYTQRSEGDWSTIGLAIDSGLLLSMVILGIYSIVRFNHVRDDDDMHHPTNVKPFGFGNGYREIEMGNVAGADVFPRASPYNDVATEYSPQGGAGSRSSRDRSLSAASLPRHDVGMEDGRRASYNHERDTQFDAYISRAPAALSHDDVEHAINTELWGNIGGHASYASIDRSGSVVSSGMVVSRPVQPRVDAANRAASWSVEPGLASVPESLRVPTIHEEHVSDEEEEEEEAAAVAGQVKPQAVSRGENQSLLLGHSRDLSRDDDDDDDRVAIHPIPGPEPDHSHYGARP